MQEAAALAMARKSAATRDAPPISPPSTSGCANSSAALSGFTLPPYSSGSKPAIVASRAAASPRMNACTACAWPRSEEHTSELQSLMRISYAVFCLKKKKQQQYKQRQYEVMNTSGEERQKPEDVELTIIRLYIIQS